MRISSAKRDGHSEAGDWLCRLTSASSVEPWQCLSRSADRDRRQEEGLNGETAPQRRIRAYSSRFMNLRVRSIDVS